jgi:hypothetical protein
MADTIIKDSFCVGARMIRWRGPTMALLIVGPVVCVEARPASGQVPTFDPSDARASFAAMAEYLARDGGRWRSANPSHDGSASSPREFGLWFARRLEGSVLEIQIVSYFPDRTVVSSHGQWTWHPGLRELRYITTHRGGGVTEGTTTFPDSVTFQTTAIRFGRAGRSSEVRDDNVLVSENVHRNETFARDGERWLSGGVYEWRRDPA